MSIVIDIIRTSPRKTESIDYHSLIFKVNITKKMIVDNSEEIATFFKTILAGGVLKILVEMRDLDYIDSSGIGILINIAKMLRARNGDIALMNVSEEIKNILNLVKFERFISMFEFEEDAINFFRLM